MSTLDFVEGEPVPLRQQLAEPLSPQGFSTIGWNDDIQRLAAAADALGWQLTAAIQCGAGRAWVEQHFPHARRDDDWESLLTTSDPVAIGVSVDAGEPERVMRAEQLRRLAQEAVPTLAVLPSCESIIGVELDMIRADTNVRLHAYNPVLEHPATERFQSAVRVALETTARAGQLDLERTLSEDSPSDALVQHCLARDAQLAQACFQGLRRVAGMGAAGAPLAQLQVQLGADRGVASWRILRGVEPGLRAVWRGAEQEFSLILKDSGAAAMTGLEGGEESFGEAAAEEGARQAWLRLLASEPIPASASGHWADACRACEAAETLPRSAARGRAYEIHQETPSEEDTFKSVMAAGSCSLILLALTVLVIVSLIESLRLPGLRRQLKTPADAAGETGRLEAPPPATPSWPLWLRIWPAYPFAALLLLQALRLAFPPRPSSGAAAVRAPPGNSPPGNSPPGNSPPGNSPPGGPLTKDAAPGRSSPGRSPQSDQPTSPPVKRQE